MKHTLNSTTAKDTSFPKLPKGIQYHINKSRLQYKVRFMVDGADIYLGVFNSLEDAVHTKNNWIAQDAIKCLSRQPELQAKLQQIAQVLPAMQQKIVNDIQASTEQEIAVLESAEIAPHELSYGNKAIINGEAISSQAVDAYLNKLYGVASPQMPENQLLRNQL